MSSNIDGIEYSYKQKRNALSHPDEPDDKRRRVSRDEERERMRGLCANALQFPVMPTTYIDSIELFLAEFTKDQANEKERRHIRSRGDVAMDPDATVRCVGDERCSLLAYYLNSMGYERSVDQMMFHEHFLQAVLPLLYGDEWDRNSARVMADHDIKTLMTEVLCMTPRRFGKSFAVAMFVLALMLARPGIKLAVFSPGKRASNSLMKLVLKFAKNIPGAERRIAGESEERLYISARELAEGVGKMSQFAKGLRNSSDTSELCCFPSSTKGK